MIRYLAIPGTGHAKRGPDWDHPGSAFSAFLREQGCVPLVESDPHRYGWSGAVDGIDRHDFTWDAFGKALYHYFVPPLLQGVPAIPPAETYIICHSHAGNVVAYACGTYGLRVQGLITVGMPIRGGRMEAVYAAAAPNITRHVHLHAGWRDTWQVLGSLFDGRFGIHRAHPHAQNFRMPGGHGDVLRDPARFPLWESEGWLDAFMGREVARVESV